MKPGDVIWGACLVAFAVLLGVPATREAFVHATSAHPYLLGFAKFAVLATMGELLSIRIIDGAWNRPRGVVLKAVTWGLIGMLIVLMFAVFAGGVAAAESTGVLPRGNGVASKFLTAFLISAIMNVTFAPVFMAAHRISDTYIDLRAGGTRPRLDDVLLAIDWKGFFKFVLLTTIPAFWIPAHTLTFLLPPNYRVLAAAFLSIALGTILSFAKRRTVRQSAGSRA
jgi:hypothetical protein